MLTVKVLVTTIDALVQFFNRIRTEQWEGMGDVGSARYEPTLLPPCPTIRVLSYNKCQEIHSLLFWVNFQKFTTLTLKVKAQQLTRLFYQYLYLLNWTHNKDTMAHTTRPSSPGHTRLVASPWCPGGSSGSSDRSPSPRKQTLQECYKKTNYIVQICSGIRSGRVLNGELYMFSSSTT